MSLCFKVRGPVSSAVTSLIVSASLTWAEFCALLKSELNISESIDVLYGFPVAVHTHPDDQLVGSVLTTNESIRVQLSASAGQQAQGSAKAKAAPTKKKATKSAPVTATATTGFGAKVVGLKAESSQKSFLVQSPYKRTFATSSSTSAQEPVPKRRRKVSSASKISSEGDIAEHLLSAVSGGAGTQNRVARKVFRNAVAHQYSSTQAVHRVNAIYSGNYTIRECGGRSLVPSASTSSYSHIEVAYNKGAGSRSQHVETVELLSKELLQGVLKVAVLGEDGRVGGAEDGREVLKPMNLSRCSPRIFWSLIFHYGPDITASIRNVLQGVDDCAWLDERKKELSEKARINQEQKEEQEAAKQARKSARGKGKTEQAGATAEFAVPASTPNSSAGNVEAKAALSAELDGVAQRLRKAVAVQTSLDDLVPEEWCESVQSYLNEHCGSTEGVAVSRLAQVECTSKVRNAIVSTRNAAAGAVTGAVALSLDQLDSWIASAQVQVFHIIWRIICGGGSERLRSALHKLRIRIPKEFRVWRAAPEGLLQGLLDSDADISDKIPYSWARSAGDESVAQGAGTTLDTERVAWMCLVSQAAQGLFPWMDQDSLAEYAQSTDDDGPGGDEDSPTKSADSGAQEGEEGWQYEASAHPYIGRRARVTVENGYWEQGTVVAYLPPEEDEPMALWKVKIDPSSEDRKLGRPERFEDLEEHEIEDAMACACEIGRAHV